ncbi:MAG: DUF3820 family protein [Flavobacteriaceae bacterium]|nr:DUF3820 family protein [Flavobacteriaceae bacterium]
MEKNNKLQISNSKKSLQPDPNFLIQLANTKMPFGKYKGVFLIELPEHYLVWYRNKGFPKGKLGQFMESAFEIRRNGLEDLIYRLKK